MLDLINLPTCQCVVSRKNGKVVLCGKPVRYAHEDRCEDCWADHQERYVGRCQSVAGMSRITNFKNQRVKVASWTQAELNARPLNPFSEARK